MSTLQVFDFHVRLAPRPDAMEALRRALETAGIQRALVTAGGVLRPETLSRQVVEGGHTTAAPDNEAVLRAAGDSGGTLTPAYFGNPHTSAVRYLNVGSKYAGLELSPAVHGIPLDDPRTEAWVSAAAQLGHWVYIVPINRAGCRVADLSALAERHPSVTFVMGHLGYGNIDYHGMRLVAGRRNVCVETSGGYSSVLLDAVERLGAERVLFGSEFPLQDPRVELMKVDVLGFDAATKAAILGGNARRLLQESA